MKTATKLSAKTRRAIKNYGQDACEKAYKENVAGNGPSTIAIEVGFSGVNAANAAINAGRELATGRNESPKTEKPVKFLYEIELHRWHPSKADQPPSSIEVVGGANDQQIAWEYGRTILRMAPNTDKSHSRIQVWRKKRRGITEKLVWEMTRAEMDRKYPPAANNCPSGVPHSSMTDGIKSYGQDELRLTWEYLASIIEDSGSNHEAITLHVNKIRAMLPDFEKLV